MKRFVFLLMLIASPLWAVEPDEILADPALEARARDSVQGAALSGVSERKH